MEDQALSEASLQTAVSGASVADSESSLYCHEDQETALSSPGLSAAQIAPSTSQTGASERPRVVSNPAGQPSADNALHQALSARQDRMQHIQQRLQERIHAKSQREAENSPQQQMLEFQRALRDLEHQEAAAQTQTAPPATSASVHEMPTVRAYEDYQRLRQEQLQRLQQYQLHAAATVRQQQLGSSPRAVAAASPPVASGDDQLRQQLLLEQERLRTLQLREQQQQQQRMYAQVSMAGATAEQLVRQQQQHMLYLPQQQRAAVSKPISASSPATPATLVPNAKAAPAKKRKKASPSPAESQMETLVRVFYSINMAKNDVDMRSGMDKMTAWVHRCTDAGLLRLAQRDFREIVVRKRSMLMQTMQWPSDLQVKFDYIQQKIIQVLLTAHKTIPMHLASASSSSHGTEGATPTSNGSSQDSEGIRVAAREHAYAALKAQIMAMHQRSATSSPASTSTPVGPKKRPMMDSASKKKDKKPRQALTCQTDNAPNSFTGTKPLQPQPAPAPVPTPTPVSPRVAQQTYDVDLSIRSCAISPDENDDKFYFPMRNIAKVMQRALSEEVPASRKAPSDSTGSEGDNAQTQSAEKSTEKTLKPVHLPIKIDDDAVALVQECTTEFLLYLTSEARDFVALDKKKSSITGTSLVQGLNNLGLPTYARVLGCFNDKIKKLQDAIAHKKLEKKILAKQQMQLELQKKEQEQRQLLQAKVEALGAQAQVSSQLSASTGAAAPATSSVTTLLKAEALSFSFKAEALTANGVSASQAPPPTPVTSVTSSSEAIVTPAESPVISSVASMAPATEISPVGNDVSASVTPAEETPASAVPS